MAATFYALKIYTRDVSNCHIQLKVDNTSSLAWINKKTAPNEAIFLIVKGFWGYCMGKNLVVSASCINKSKNVVADKESRKLRNNLEWFLQTPIFDKIRSVYGPVIIDLFASRINAKVGRFYSSTLDPEACGHDAFSFSWQQEHFYTFSPFSCIPQVINKIELESGTGILVVPLFTGQHWLTRLLRILTSEPLLLPKSHTCSYFPHRLRNPPNIHNFRIIAFHVSGKSIDRKEFHQKLQKSSYNPGNQGLEINTTPIRNSGYSFLLNGIKIHCIPI